MGSRQKFLAGWAFPPRRKALKNAILTAIILLILGWQASNWYQTRLLENQRAQILRELSAYGSTLTLNIYQRLALLEGLKAFVETHPPENHNIQEFESFARGLYLSNTGIRNLSIISQTGEKYLFPKRATGTVRGQTLLRAQPLNEAAGVATGSRQTILHGPFRLQQGSLGLGGQQAVFKNNQYWGTVAVTLDLPVILADTNLDNAAGTLNLALRDQTGTTFFGNITTFESDPVLFPVKILDNTWEFAASPVNGWDNAITAPLFVFRVAGFIIAALAVTLAYLSTNRHTRLQLAVKSRTLEISKINQSLENELAERAKTEQALKETEARSTALIKAIPDLMIRMDGSGNYLEVISSSTIESIVPPAQMVGKNVLDILPKPAARDRVEHIKQAILTRTPQIYEYQLDLRGQPHWYEARLVAYADNEVLIIIRDITQRRHMETDLQKSRLRLAEAQRIANLGHWEWDIINDQSFWSDEVFQLYGLKPGQLKPNYKVFLSLVHPDDRAVVEGAVSAALSNQTPYNIDHRIILADGTIRVLSQQAEIKVDAQGRPARMVGTMQDITERKLAEQERERLLAAEREQRLLAETLHEVTLALNSQPSHKAVLDEILRQTKRLTPYSAANLMLLEGDMLRLACWQGYEAFGPVAFLADMVQPIDNFPLEAAIIRDKTALVVPDTQQEPHWVTVPETAWIKSHLSMPICRQNRVLGLLRLDSNTPNAFSPANTHRLQPVVNAAAIALENARLYEQALKDANTRSLLLQEVNHRVKNNLSAIIGILYAGKRYAASENKTAYAAIMSALINRIQGLAAVHSLLSHSEWAPLNLTHLIGQIIRSVLQALPHGQEVRLKVTPSPIKVTSNQAYYLAQIINELTTNTVRHATTGKIGQISVNISTQNGQVVIEFADNGPGYPPALLSPDRQVNTVGLNLIQSIVQQSLKGEVTLQNRPGALTTIRFNPKNNNLDETVTASASVTVP